MALPAIIQKFISGFRLINGDDLNNLVSAVNNIQGNGTGVPPGISAISEMSAAKVIVNTVTLSAIAGVSIPLVAGGVYNIEGEFPVVTVTGTSGVALSLDTTNSLTLTNLNLTGKFFTASTVATVNTTSFQTGIGSTTTVTLAELVGGLTVGVAGNLIVKAGGNAASGTTTTLSSGGSLQVTRVS